MKQADAKENLSQQLWAYCTRVYDCPGVAEECLRLQDECGMDVLLLLTAGFCSRYRIAWNRRIYAALGAESAAMRDDFLLPVRAMRRRAKTVATTSVYQALKSAELALERWQVSQIGQSLAVLAERGDAIPENTQAALRVCVPPDNRGLQAQLLPLAALLGSANRPD